MQRNNCRLMQTLACAVPLISAAALIITCSHLLLMALNFEISGASGFLLLPLKVSIMLSYSLRAGGEFAKYLKIDFGRDLELRGVAEAGRST
jgi:hypothetical protein